jgi:hypothetical protein
MAAERAAEFQERRPPQGGASGFDDRSFNAIRSIGGFTSLIPRARWCGSDSGSRLTHPRLVLLDLLFADLLIDNGCRLILLFDDQVTDRCIADVRKFMPWYRPLAAAKVSSLVLKLSGAACISTAISGAITRGSCNGRLKVWPVLRHGHGSLDYTGRGRPTHRRA